MVPHEWTWVTGAVGRAKTARGQMRDKGLSQAMRDQATVIYSRALDEIFSGLDAMDEHGTLRFVTQFLTMTEHK